MNSNKIEGGSGDEEREMKFARLEIEALQTQVKHLQKLNEQMEFAIVEGLRIMRTKRFDGPNGLRSWDSLINTLVRGLDSMGIARTALEEKGGGE